MTDNFDYYSGTHINHINNQIKALEATDKDFSMDKIMPTDNENILGSLEDIKYLLNSLKFVGSLIIPEFYLEIVNAVYYQEKLMNNPELNQVYKDRILIDCKIYLLHLINVLGLEPLNVNNRIFKLDTSDVSKFIKSVNINFPEFPIKIKPRKIPKNKLYKTNNNELSPNSPQSYDILSSLIRPYEWVDEENRITYVKEHKNNGYSQLSIFNENSNNQDIRKNILTNFDWKDRKILRVLMGEAIKEKGAFHLSLKWLLTLIGDNRTSTRVNGKRLTTLEKLEDLRTRLKRYDSIWYFWRYTLGKKEFSKLPDGTPIAADLKIFNVKSIIVTKKGKGSDFIAEIEPGSWFDFNQNILQEYTRIPKKLLSIDTKEHWLAFAIGERICILFRNNKEKFIKSTKGYENGQLVITIESLLNEILNPEELKLARNTPYKGTRLKQAILKNIDYLSQELNWTFKWRFRAENENFETFYKSASFTVKLDCELEADILGEKIVKQPKNLKSTSTFWITGETIKALRKKLGITQKNFATRLGYSRSQIAKIEADIEVPSEEFVKILFLHYKQELKDLQK
jgi:DNA-binding transcriptional regulator YiaG